MPLTTRTVLLAAAIVLTTFAGALGARRLLLDERLLVPLGRAVSGPLSPSGNDCSARRVRRTIQYQ